MVPGKRRPASLEPGLVARISTTTTTQAPRSRCGQTAMARVNDRPVCASTSATIRPSPRGSKHPRGAPRDREQQPGLAPLGVSVRPRPAPRCQRQIWTPTRRSASAPAAAAARYAVGDADVVPTDELRAHEREALVALHGLCTSFIEHTDLGTAGARCKELIREAQQLRQPLAGLVGGGASPDVNLCTRFVLALSPCARLLPANAALLAETEGSRSRSRSGSGDAGRRRHCHHRWRLQLLRDGHRQRERPAASGGQVRGSAGGGGGAGDEDGESVPGFLCCVEPRRAGVVVARTRRRSYYHSLTSPSSTPRLSASLPQSNSVPDSLEGAAMAVPPPFTLAVPVERGARQDRRNPLSPTVAGFAAGFAAGGPPPGGHRRSASGNSSKEAASPRQSRSSSKEAATPKRGCGFLHAVGKVVSVSFGEQWVTDDSFKQAAAAAVAASAATSAAAGGAAAVAAAPPCPRGCATSADGRSRRPAPCRTRAGGALASAASERYSDDGSSPRWAAARTLYKPRVSRRQLAALGPPPTLDGSFRDSEASDFVFGG